MFSRKKEPQDPKEARLDEIGALLDEESTPLLSKGMYLGSYRKNRGRCCRLLGAIFCVLFVVAASAAIIVLYPRSLTVTFIEVAGDGYNLDNPVNGTAKLDFQLNATLSLDNPNWTPVQINKLNVSLGYREELVGIDVVFEIDIERRTTIEHYATITASNRTISQENADAMEAEVASTGALLFEFYAEAFMNDLYGVEFPHVSIMVEEDIEV